MAHLSNGFYFIVLVLQRLSDNKVPKLPQNKVYQPPPVMHIKQASSFLLARVCSILCVSTGLFHYKILLRKAQWWLILEELGFRWLAENPIFSRPSLLLLLWNFKYPVQYMCTCVLHWTWIWHFSHMCMWLSWRNVEPPLMFSSNTCRASVRLISR